MTHLVTRPLAIVAGLLAAWIGHSAQAGVIYWTDLDSDTIGRASADGTNLIHDFIGGADDPNGLAVDGTYLYWSNTFTIGRAQLDGSAATSSFITNAGLGPVDVAVDGSFIYWPEVASAISRANLDGTGVNNSFTTAAELIGSIAVDESFIYWVNSFTSAIGRGNIDGTGLDQSFVSGVAGVGGIAVDGMFLYWTSSSGIGRARLDGSEADASFIAGATSPVDLTLDGRFIYWTNLSSGTIGRANLDGTGVDDGFLTVGGRPAGIVFSPVPEPTTGLLVALGVLGMATRRRRLASREASIGAAPSVLQASRSRARYDAFLTWNGRSGTHPGGARAAWDSRLRRSRDSALGEGVTALSAPTSSG